MNFTKTKHMNITKSILIISALITTSLCSAQSKKTDEKLEKKSLKKTEALHKEVKLTKAQTEKINAINFEYLSAKQELEKKLKALKKVKNKKINAVLTDDQKKKLDELKKKKKK